ncbi:PhaM family polyhydroxyalkanoate granule multifunctional regulatory protein [Hydrogenophaga sp.]|uniref:PhaM family polyhydroxyalkanoate granule multifunctional regulatory protein n=1 Tax=Hydrogenophaga sp. TaxID=1904254 RepID=UPI003568B940
MSDASGSGFGKFVPGFEFLQNLAGQAAGGIGQGISNNIPQLPNLGNWVAPTVNVEELDKRIEELKAVHFWLDQNAKALGATIQALEVQKMTLSTLQSMNFSFGDVANALKLKAQDTMAGFTGVPTAPVQPPNPFPGLEIPERTYGTAAAPQSAPPQASAPPAPAKPPVARKEAVEKSIPATAAPGGVVDPVQWWGALTEQFQAIATNAMKDAAKQSALDTTRQVASGLTGAAVKTATGTAGKVGRKLTGSVARKVGQAAAVGKAVASKARPRAAAKASPDSSTVRAPTARLTGNEWPMPGSFFPAVAAFGVAPPPAKPPAKASTNATSKTKTAGKAAGSARAKGGAAKTARPAAKKSSAARKTASRKAR